MTLDVLQSCSEQSLKAKEPILGTATGDVAVWLLLEHPGRWEADIQQNDLPDSVRTWLAEALARIPNSRLLFVRRDRPSRHLSFYLITTRPQRSIYRFQGAHHEEFTTLDLPAMVEGGATVAEAHGGERGRPLYVVCTHGKRDACCARKGVAFHRALEETELDGELWQSSHQGGHRFAPTMLYLPFGVHYGRLEPADAAAMVSAHTRGRLHDLGRYRGLTTLAGPAQAAEAWLREALDERRMDAFRVGKVARDPGDRHRVELIARDGTTHQVTVLEKNLKSQRLASCDATAPTAVTAFDVVRHESRG